MKVKPQTIQIFLPDGSPTSIREAEITNRLLKAILFPRNKIPEVSKREMVRFTGVYFLFGATEDGAKPLVYIGEGEDCFERIKAHHRKKDFWTHGIIVTTKTDEYTKTDGKFLEHYCLEQADAVGRYKTENDAGSKKPSIPESREYDLLDNFETLKILLATLGYPLYESKRKSTESSMLFYVTGQGVKASGNLTDEGFLIYKGSQAKIEETPSCHTYLINMRSQLISAGILSEREGIYVFTQDHIFNSPSTAGGVILGRSTNGWTKWKNRDGKTLDDLKRKLNGDT